MLDAPIYTIQYDIGLENLGIAMRNNKPFIVILDSGWVEEIEETFY